MRIASSFKVFAVLALLTGFMTGCKKDDKVKTPPAMAHFTNKTSGTYAITAPGVTYKVPIGVTTVSDQARTVKVSITSPTGAQQGVQYTANTTVTIPAGKAVDSLEIKGVYNQYTSGRKDTLIITIEDQDVAHSTYNSKFTLLMRGPCFEPDIVLSELVGAYANTNEDWGGSPYGPYTTTITAVNQTSPTTGTITVANIFDNGWSPLTFTLDWTDPNNRVITLAEQDAGGNAGSVFGAAYNGKHFAVRPVPASLGGDVGTFSYCNQTLTLKMLVGIVGVGYSTDLYVVNMQR